MQQKSGLLFPIILIVIGLGFAFLAWADIGIPAIDAWLDRPSMQLGLYAGLVAGAMTLPLVRDPRSGFRFVIGAVAGLLIVGVIQAVEFGVLSGGLSARDAAAMSRFGETTIIRLVYGIVGGALLGLLTYDFYSLLVGGLVGLMLGVVVGNLFYLLLDSQNITLGTELFVFLVGLISGSILLTFSSGADNKS